MIVAGQRLSIVVATKAVAFRRGHDGLAATVPNELGLAHLLEKSWPTEALLVQITVAKFCDFNPLNRQSVAMARNGAPIDRADMSDWMGRTWPAKL